MSEEQQDPNNIPPQPATPVPTRRLVTPTSAVGGDGPKPRMLAGGGGASTLKIAMRPEQEAAIARAKEQRSASEAAQQVAEAQFAAEQARYEAEMKAYEEYQAAEAQRLEQEAAAVAAAPVETAPVATPTPEAPAPENADPNDPVAIAALAAKQLEAAQALMAQAQAMQAAAGAQTPTAAIPASVSRPAPTPSLTPPVATPAIQPTTRLPGTSRNFTQTKPSSPADFDITPMWKKKGFYIPLITLVVILGGAIAIKYPEWSQRQAQEERYHEFSQKAVDDSVKSLSVLPSDAEFLLERLRTDKLNWSAASETLNKMMKGTKGLSPMVMEDITMHYNTYLLPEENPSDVKVERLYHYVLRQKNNPPEIREKVLNFYDIVPDTAKPKTLKATYPVLVPDDILFLVDTINSANASGNNALRKAAEFTASQLISKSEDKDAMNQVLRLNYDKSDDSLKNIYIRLMGRTGDTTSLAFLQSLVDNPNTDTIALTNVINALSVWPNDDSIPLLMKLKDSPKAKDLSKIILDALYKSVAKPGVPRDMAKLNPLLDFLKSKNTAPEKTTLLSWLQRNYISDKWAEDLISTYLDDRDDYVSDKAEKALEALKKRIAPDPSKKTEDSDEDEE